MVLRNYLPSYVRWVAIACAAVGIGLAVALRHWAFLLIAVGGLAMVVVGNAVIGVTRIAVDGRLLAVRQVLRWQGPIDVGDLVAIGYAPAVSLRMSGRWRFVQRERRTTIAALSAPGLRAGARRAAGAARRPPGRHRVLRARLSVAGLPAPPGAVRAPVVGARQHRPSSRSSPTSEPRAVGAEPPIDGSTADRNVRSRGRRPRVDDRRYGPYSGYILSPVARKPGALGTAGLSGGGP